MHFIGRCNFCRKMCILQEDVHLVGRYAFLGGCAFCWKLCILQEDVHLVGRYAFYGNMYIL